MRITKATNNILRININSNIQYLVCKDVDYIRQDKVYFNSVIKKELLEIKQKYILMASKSTYQYTFIGYNDKEAFINACCEPMSLNLNKDDLNILL